MKRFLSSMMHNHMLAHILEALFIVHFKLDKRTEVGPSSGPLCIGAEMAMLPYGWLSRNDFYMTTPARPLPIAISPSGIDSSGRRRNAGVGVFLQITGLGYLSDTEARRYDREHRATWEKVALAQHPLPSPDAEVQFIGLLLLKDGDDHNQYTIFPLPIRKMDLDAFRKGTFFSTYSWAEVVLGERVPRPLTTTILIRFVSLSYSFI